jgi:hypothetical protein
MRQRGPFLLHERVLFYFFIGYFMVTLPRDSKREGGQVAHKMRIHNIEKLYKKLANLLSSKAKKSDKAGI